MSEAMDSAFAGGPCQFVLPDGRESALNTAAWSCDAGAVDDLLFLDACTGPTLDVGCGPGRLTGALAERGVATLGTDISREAVRQTQARGATAVQRDVYDALPGTRSWKHVLLADGNIGIGGNAIRLLSRLAQLLHPAGSIVVELSPTGTSHVFEDARLRVGGRLSVPFAWATLGRSSVDAVASEAGLYVAALDAAAGRTVATLRLS